MSKLHLKKGSSGGTPHPFSDVTIEDSGHGMFSILTPNNKKGYFGFSDQDDDYVGGMEYDHNSNSMILRVNNHGHNLAINSSGNVGIGITNPNTKLEVNGDVTVGNTGRVGSFINIIGAGTNQNFGLQLGAASNPDSRASILSSTTTGGISFSVQENSAMRINSNGNVGIGTTTPLSSLHVSSRMINNSSINRIDANLVIEAKGNVRAIDKGASLGFVVPANTDGGNPWQQGRILVAADNISDRNASGRMYLQTRYLDAGAWKWRDNLVLRSSGNVGIGTNIPDSKLTVAGKIHAREVQVTINAGADFVFENDYKLPALKDVEQFIKANKHLPEIASEKEMQDNGLYLADMNIKLLQKVEELTLYTIDQEKRIESIEAKNEKLMALVDKILKTKSEK